MTQEEQRAANEQRLIDVWNQDLNQGNVSQSAAQDAVTQIQRLGGTVTSTPQYSTPDNGQLNYSALPIPPSVNSQLSGAGGGTGATGAVPKSNAITRRTILDNSDPADAGSTGSGGGDTTGTNGGTSNPGFSNPNQDPNGNYQIPFKDPKTGQVVFSADMNQIGQYLASGYQVLRSDGSVAKVTTNFAGTNGYLIDNLPINTVITGQMTQQQYDLLKQNGIDPVASGAIEQKQITGTGGIGPNNTIAPAGPGGPGTGTSTTGTGTPGGSNSGGVTTPSASQPPAYTTGNKATDPVVPPGDTKLNGGNAAAQTQGVVNTELGREPGANNLVDTASSFYNTMGQLATQNQTTRDQYLSGIIPGLSDAIKPFLDRANNNEGLDPKTMSALRTQSTATIPGQFNNAAQALETNLLQRGAEGGTGPASGQDIVNGFAPLYSGMAQARSAADTSTQLANFNAIMGNRNLATQAIGAGNSLASTVGNIYNPSQYSALGLAGLNAGTGAFNAGTANMNSVNSGMNTLADLEPSSFKNMLLASLLSSGSSYLGNGGFNSIVNLFKNIFGGNNSGPTSNPNGTGPVNTGGTTSGGIPDDYNGVFDYATGFGGDNTFGTYGNWFGGGNGSNVATSGT